MTASSRTKSPSTNPTAPYTLAAPIDYETAPDLPGGGKGYQFTVKVTDGIAVDQAKVTINVTNVAPTAVIDLKRSGDDIIFDGSKSFDPQGTKLKYLWKIHGPTIPAETGDEVEAGCPVRFEWNGPETTVTVTLFVSDGFLVTSRT